VRASLLPPLILAFLLFAACSDDKGEGGEVKVDLSEWDITPNVASIENGDVTFDIDNKGPDHEHELVIIRTDFAPDKLPTKDDGSVDEEAPGVDVVGQIQKVEPDDDGSGIFTLDPGKYVLICNLVDEDEGEKLVHYQKGMRVAFTAQ
jgi:hypothetical protein